MHVRYIQARSFASVFNILICIQAHKLLFLCADKRISAPHGSFETTVSCQTSAPRAIIGEWQKAAILSVFK